MPIIAVLWIICVPYTSHNGAGFCYDHSPTRTEEECKRLIGEIGLGVQKDGAFCVKRYEVQE